ncbi:MAG: helix-turn-helix domain-containing protein [Dermatophilaceae bacterium]
MYRYRVLHVPEIPQAAHVGAGFPDHRVEIVLNLGGGWGPVPALSSTKPLSSSTCRLLPPESAWVVGAGMRTRHLAFVGMVDVINISLTPAGALRLLGVRAAELVHRWVDLRDLWDTQSVDRLVDAATHTAALCRPDALDTLLLGRTVQSAKPATHSLNAEVVDAALTSIQMTMGGGSVDDLAAHLGLPARTLRHAFTTELGLGAKAVWRLARLGAVLQDIFTGSCDLAGLAARHGFSDQAHLTREVHALTGLPPGRLRQQWPRGGLSLAVRPLDQVAQGRIVAEHTT